MARLRVRFKFNPGRKGAPLDKLGEFAEQTEKFLRSLASDLHLDAKKGEWIGDNFADGSFEGDAEYGGAITESARDDGVAALEIIFGDDPLKACNTGLVRPVTIGEYAKIGEVLSPGDHFEAGVYIDDAATVPPPLKQVTYRKTAEIKQLLKAPYVTEGAIQGIFYNWTPGAEPPFFTVRALQSWQLVHCEYHKENYHLVHEATEVENAILMVYGTIQWERLTNSILKVLVSNVVHTKTLTGAEFNRLFGSNPNFTGDMTTAEYIDWLRGDGEQP